MRPMIRCFGISLGTSTAGVGGRVQTWDATTGRDPVPFAGLGGDVQGVTFSGGVGELVYRHLAGSLIEKCPGWKAVYAGNGREALEVIPRNRTDLVLTDMVMPEGLNGRELADQLKKRKPALKIIFSSGYSTELFGKELAHGDVAFLPKPYPPQQLAELVRRCLDSRN